MFHVYWMFFDIISEKHSRALTVWIEIFASDDKIFATKKKDPNPCCGFGTWNNDTQAKTGLHEDPCRYKQTDFRSSQSFFPSL